MNTRDRMIKDTRETIKQTREWLDRLEKQLDMKHETDVITAFLLNQIAECATALIYRAGVINGTALHQGEVAK